jgi:hypothetical protein
MIPVGAADGRDEGVVPVGDALGDGDGAGLSVGMIPVGRGVGR